MKKKRLKKSEEAVKVWKERNTSIPSDVNGSYTGTPLKKSSTKEAPDVDSDDL